MNIIRFNVVTREIELAGEEAFIEANFPLILDIAGRRKDVPLSSSPIATETQTVKAYDEGQKVHKLREASPSQPRPEKAVHTKSMVDALPAQVAKPTTGKFILRRARTPHAAEQVPKPMDTPMSAVVDQTVSSTQKSHLSIEALKQNLGVSDRQIEKIIQEAEREGRIRRDTEGRYVWI